MKIDDTTDAFWVLYLMNILQPVTQAELETETQRILEAANRKTDGFSISRSLSVLVRANMALVRGDGRYSVTVLGLQKLSLFDLGMARDKNRMFVLKNRFKKW